MATVAENLERWNETYDWRERGEEWSEVWGGSRSQWTGALRPRISHALPANRILEIGCGFGRWSRFLRNECHDLILVDLAERCVEACRQLFKGDSGTTFVRTDGVSLAGVADESVDLVFSFDSLVHAEMSTIEAYLVEIRRILTPDGVAFLHHSNLGSLPLVGEEGNPHWRALSVSAENVAESAASAGLARLAQEVIDWGGVEDCDVLSTFARSERSVPTTGRVVRNPNFMGEARSLSVRWSLYAPLARGEGSF